MDVVRMLAIVTLMIVCCCLGVDSAGQQINECFFYLASNECV